jgi:outer membrane protein assembly factor BamA
VKSQQGSIRIPYQDDYLLLSMPHVVRNRLQLDLRVAYTSESTQKYYGIGNAVVVLDARSLDDPLFEYGRIHVSASADGTLRVIGPVFLQLWIAYVRNWLDVAADTKLAEDAVSTNPTVRRMITTFEPTSTVTFSYGVAFDTRDDNVSPARGQYHASRVDLSPGGTSGVPQKWGDWNTTARWYVPIGSDRSALAVRLVADLLFGTPPFYQLDRFNDMGAFGGPSGVRGVPAQRYSGMIKLLGNVEARKMLFDFDFLSKKNAFGVAVFADGGRVFATYSKSPELDGTSLGLKIGIGGGLRLLAGQSFVLRADAAFSPDARPIGVYVAAGQPF